MPESLWAAVTPAGVDYPALVGPASCDVVIVGGGLTGLSAALHLRRAGVGVVVVEAAEIGWGASGRNNGQVIPTLSRADPDEIIARHRSVGERFVGMLGGSAKDLFEVIAAEKIDAEAEQTGWVQPVHSPGRMRLAERRVAQWSKAGVQTEVLSRDAVAGLVGSPAWDGGWWVPSGGHINPLALVRGLARAVVARGGIVHSRSPVLAFGRAGSRWVVTARDGRIDARALVLATNVATDTFSARLRPDIVREMVPVVSWQMATQPLPDALLQTVMPRRPAVSDTRADLRFMRFDARNRIVTGGGGGPSQTAEAVQRVVGRRLAETFPQLAGLRGGIQFDYVWNGTIGATRDGLPHIHTLGPDGYTWVGCNGRGVALAVAIGREFARGILGTPRSELALPFTEPDQIPFYRLAKYLVPAIRPLQARYRDSRELRD